MAGLPAAALPSESGADRQQQLFPGGAATGPLHGYTGSVMSSVASCQGLSIQSALRKLQRAIMKMRENLEEKGPKQISFQQERMSEYASKLCSKLDLAEDIEAHLLIVMEGALEESEELAERAMQRLYELARDERETRANVSARPRLSYETFSGDISQFPTFQANQRELF